MSTGHMRRTFVRIMGTALQPRDRSGDRKTAHRHDNRERQPARAEKELRRLLRTLDTGEHVDPSRMTVRRWLTMWLATVREEVAPKTHERYAEIVRKLPRAVPRKSADRKACSCACPRRLQHMGNGRSARRQVRRSFGANSASHSSYSTVCACASG